MAIKASGNPLLFTEIEAEFGQNIDRDLGEYRISQTVGGLTNQPLDAGIPQSGKIKFSDFYSKRLNVIIDYHTGETENRPTVAKTRYDATAGTGTHTVLTGGWYKERPTNSGGTKTRIHVNKTIGSSTGGTGETHCAVRTGTGWNSGTVLTVEIGSSGALYGAGGDGGHGGTGESTGGCGSGQRNGCAGEDGNSGLGIQYDGTSVINNGIISGGYGGGGGGGYRKVEKEEFFAGPTAQASGGGGGGGQGLPGGSGGGGNSNGTAGTISSSGNGGNGGTTSNSGVTARGGGGGGGGSDGEGGTGTGGNNGGEGTSSSGGSGADGAYSGNIENGSNNYEGEGGAGGGTGAAIRRTSGISVSISDPVGGIVGATDATGVS